jgi:hypothetical protein
LSGEQTEGGKMDLDLHHSSAWLILASILAFYTISVFWFSFKGERSPLFSGQLKNHFSEIAFIHEKFLLYLFVFMLLAVSIDPFLPHWMTEEVISSRGGKHSLEEILCFIIFIVFLSVEHRLKHLKFDTNDSDLTDNRF